MKTIHVHLADAPTDALVYLVDHRLALTVPDLAAAVAPPDADDPIGTTNRALFLLLDMGYVHLGYGLWAATREGIDAVEAARLTTPAHPDEHAQVIEDARVPSDGADERPGLDELHDGARLVAERDHDLYGGRP